MAEWKALVTGASGGIGRDIAAALAACGASVCAAGRRDDRLAGTVEAAKELSGTIVPFAADLQSDQDIEGLACFVGDRWNGRMDILVHSAGLFFGGGVGSGELNRFDQMWSVNVRAPFLLTKLCLPMLRRSRGAVVFINSSIGLSVDRADFAMYAATKHALRAVADSLKAEVNPDGVRVISVYPGRTATEMQEDLHLFEGREYQPDNLIQPPDLAALIAAVLGLPPGVQVTDMRILPTKKV